jgi:hypothetical protein
LRSYRDNFLHWRPCNEVAPSHAIANRCNQIASSLEPVLGGIIAKTPSRRVDLINAVEPGQQARIALMIVGPVPIRRLQLREPDTDWVIGSFVCSHDLETNTARIRRAAAVRGWEIVGEMATEIWAPEGNTRR